jgi:single-strand DNA-binding protein
MAGINRIIVTGGLTRDPALRTTPTGTPVATLRLVFTTLRRADDGWRERRNYIDVELWGAQAENAMSFLTRGRQIAVDGRLEWSEYETRDGAKRHGYKIIADGVQYLPGGGKKETGARPAGAGSQESTGARARDGLAP